MKSAGFIVAMKTYLFRKGMSAILNKIPGATVVKEFAGSSGLEAYVKNNPGDYLVAGKDLLEHSGGIPPAFDPSMERTIVVNERPGSLESGESLEMITINDSKEKILGLFQSLVDQHKSRYPNAPEQMLTPREKTILRLVSMGYTNKQIAGELFLSAHTVITHRKNISSKLGIKSVSGLTIYAIVNNIITLGELSSKADQ